MGKDDANRILQTIGESYLTEKESALLPEQEGSAIAFFKLLSGILKARGSEGDAVERLNDYARSQGVRLSEKPIITSNILFCGGT